VRGLIEGGRKLKRSESSDIRIQCLVSQVASVWRAPPSRCLKSWASGRHLDVTANLLDEVPEFLWAIPHVSKAFSVNANPLTTDRKRFEPWARLRDAVAEGIGVSLWGGLWVFGSWRRAWREGGVWGEDGGAEGCWDLSLRLVCLGGSGAEDCVRCGGGR
jgi:hypothetical protein